MVHGIRSKLILLIFGYLLIVILAVTVMIFNFYSVELRDRADGLLEQVTLEAASGIDDLFEDMDTLSTQLLSSETMQKLLYEAVEHSDPVGNYFDLDIEAKRTAQDILWAFHSPKARIENASIFNDSDYVGLRYAPSASRLREVAALPIWEIGEGEFYRVIPPHLSYWDTMNRKTVFSLSRRYIASAFGFSDLGVIEIEDDFEKISSLCRDAELRGHGRILIYGEDGVLLYPQNQDDLPMNLGDSVAAIDQGLSSVLLDGSEYRSMRTDLSWAPWSVLLLQPVETYEGPLRRFLQVLILVISGFAALVLVLLVFIVNAVTRPISRLIEEIDGYTLEGDAREFSTFRAREAVVVQAAFKRLIGRLKDSVDRLMLANETELNLRIMNLQAKINPHFLFNSLTAISAVAMEEGSSAVPLMCSQLSELFRYTSETDEDQNTTLGDELNNIRLYMEFMKWRYEDDFSFQVETQGDVHSHRVPKLILQPLVENSFTHGFRNAYAPFFLSVRSGGDPSGWWVEISDNGGGYDPVVLASLEAGLEEIDRIFRLGRDYRDLKTGDRAILNIYIRLKLQYREALRMDLSNGPEEVGSRIRIEARS